MSGHNKWSKIKHKKAGADAAKSKVFGKMAKLITSEAKKAGGNRESPGLKNAVEQARAVNMPNDNIERAIKRATESGATELEPVVYEAYGPGGTAIIISGLTDNKNRTVAEVKATLSSYNLGLAEQGAALWAFSKEADGTYTPVTHIEVNEADAGKLDTIITALEEHDDVQHVYTNMHV